MEMVNNILLMEMYTEDNIRMEDSMVLEHISGNQMEHSMREISKMG